jgi:hypothetical protein
MVSCLDFQKNRNEYIKNRALPVQINETIYELPILVATTQHKTCSGSPECNNIQVKSDCNNREGCNWEPKLGPNNFSDCAMKNPNSAIKVTGKDPETGFLTEYETNKSYTYILDQIPGVPQLTMGFNLRYCEYLFKYTSQIVEKWNTDNSQTATLGNPRGLEIIRNAVVYTNIQLENINSNYAAKGLKLVIPIEVKNLLLLCNYYILISEMELTPEEKQKPFKYRFFYKIRTNLRTIYDSFSPDSQEGFKNLILYIFSSDTIIGYTIKEFNVSEWFDKLILNPNYGYIIEEIPPNIYSNITRFGIYSITPKNLDIFDKKGIKYKPINYLPNFTYSAPHIHILGNVLTYTNNEELINFDIGEWYYNPDNIILEMRALQTVEQLATFNKTNTKVEVVRGKRIGEVQMMVVNIVSNFLNNALK